MSDYIALILRETSGPLGNSRDYIEVQASTQKAALREAQRQVDQFVHSDFVRYRVVTSFPKSAAS